MRQVPMDSNGINKQWLVLLSIIYFTVRIDAGSTTDPWRKCCPMDQLLVKRNSIIECAPAPDNTTIFHATTDYVLMGFPKCDGHYDELVVTATEFERLKFGRKDQWTCFEIFYGLQGDNNTLASVECVASKKDAGKISRAQPPHLAKIRRCCPRGEIFNREIKSCLIEQRAIGRSSEDRFLSLVKDSGLKSDFVIVERVPPRCEDSGALFDYHVNVSQLRYQAGKLHIKLPASVNGEEDIALGVDNACLELSPESWSKKQLIVRACRDLKLCQSQTCLMKCCAEDEVYIAAKYCEKIEKLIEPMPFHPTLREISKNNSFVLNDYGIRFGIPCKDKKFPVPPDDNWTITSEGYVVGADAETLMHNGHCIDIYHNSTYFDETVYTFVCFDEAHPENTVLRLTVNAVLESISCIFLLATFLVYACLPALQNLHGKTLMCHVASLFMAYANLAVITQITADDGPICKVIGYITLYAFLSAFSWLNVMCFDIWWTFGAVRGSTPRGRKQTKKFVIYCIYAWTLALVISTLAIIADNTTMLPIYLRAHIGEDSCWFLGTEEYYGEITFFIGPVIAQLISNVVFFVLTSIHCSKVKAEIKRVIADPLSPKSRRFHADKTKLMMNVKLFVVMGVTWIFEVISFFINHFAKDLPWRREFFYVADGFNSLQGVVIFFLFVMKARVYHALRKRLGLADTTGKGISTTTTALQDPYKIRKSVSNSTVTSAYAVSSAP